MTKPVVGFIGLGLMGNNMVECLQKNGFELKVMDLNQNAVAAVVARGGATEGTSANLQAAFDAGMGDGNVPEIFDYFLKLEK
jgi:3-hydroxyisobutyrate dehydrogenase